MDAAIKELKTMWQGILLCNLLLLLLAVGIQFFDYTLVLGLLVGNGYAVVNFIMIGSSVDDVLELSPSDAKSAMSRGYAKRMLITSLVIIFGMTASFINPVGVIVPLFFPKIAFNCRNIFFRKGGEKK